MQEKVGKPRHRLCCNMDSGWIFPSTLGTHERYLYSVIHIKGNILFIFSSPEHKVLMVSYCDRALSVVRRRPSSVVRRASSVVRKLFYLNIFFSETTHWILTKLHRNDPWVVPYQSCSNGSDWLHK